MAGGICAGLNSLFRSTRVCQARACCRCLVNHDEYAGCARARRRPHARHDGGARGGMPMPGARRRRRADSCGDLTTGGVQRPTG
eukprot:6958685-Lingulodinium_polyedra.AAC.1